MIEGRRNEPARARRRQLLKKEMSLTSVPKSEEETADLRPKMTLNNHFGWQVLCRTEMGDAFYPHVFQYYEKPDISGRDFEKVTYVLYMDKGTVIDKKTSLKETQTAVSGILVSEEKPQEYTVLKEYTFPKEDRSERSKLTIPPDSKLLLAPEEQGRYYRKKKRKLISEFYYIPRERSRSRSKERYKGGDSDADIEGKKIISDYHLVRIPDTESKLIGYKNIEGSERLIKHVDIESDNARNVVTTEVHRRRNLIEMGPNLRAGAESLEQKNKSNARLVENSPMVIKWHPKKIEYFMDRSARNKITEKLLKTSSGTNQYLFVSGKKKQSNGK